MYLCTNLIMSNIISSTYTGSPHSLYLMQIQNLTMLLLMPPALDYELIFLPLNDTSSERLKLGCTASHRKA